VSAKRSYDIYRKVVAYQRKDGTGKEKNFVIPKSKRIKCTCSPDTRNIEEINGVFICIDCEKSICQPTPLESLNLVRAAVGFKKIEPKYRVCLKCNEKFISEGIHHRICCQTTEEE
jgi:hypothetical protein